MSKRERSSNEETIASQPTKKRQNLRRLTRNRKTEQELPLEDTGKMA